MSMKDEITIKVPEHVARAFLWVMSYGTNADNIQNGHFEEFLSTVKKAVTEKNSLKQKATEAGAEERYVTKEGYTKLPEIMMEDLGLDREGGHVWFVRRSLRCWEAWLEDKLHEYLSGTNKVSER